VTSSSTGARSILISHTPTSGKASIIAARNRAMIWPGRFARLKVALIPVLALTITRQSSGL
jgi:hypothetical protein